MLYKFTSNLVLLTTLVIQTTTTSMAMDVEHPDRNPSTPNQTAQTEKQSRDEILDGLQFYVKILIAHQHDTYDLYEEAILTSKDLSASDLESYRQTNSTNLKYLDDILHSLVEVKEGRKTVDLAIGGLLGSRYGLIGSTRQNVARFYQLMDQKDGGMLYGPTDPALNSRLSPTQKKLAIRAINKYQMINNVIVGLSKLVDLRTLSEITKNHLRASVSLHPILEGKTTDLGRPDQTFHLGEVSKEDFRDWECFQEMIAQRHYNVPYPAFLKQPEVPKKAKDPRSFLTGTLAVEKKKPPRKGAKMGALSKASKSKAKDNKPNKEDKAREAGETGMGEAEAIVADQVSVVPPLGKEVATKPEMAPIPLEKAPEVALPKAEEPQAAVTNPKQVDKIPATTKATSPKTKRRSPTEGLISEKPKPESEVTDDKRPRGAIHYTSSVTYERVELPRKLEARRQDIFNPQMLNTVKYKQFAKLWRHINGENSIHQMGGSHKELLDQNGRVISGTYADGNETFGKNTIKYIRDALTQIGYGK